MYDKGGGAAVCREAGMHLLRPKAAVDMRAVGFGEFFRSCRAIHGGILLWAMLASYLVSDPRPLPSPSR